MIVGIVGADALKWTPTGAQAAKDRITAILTSDGVTTLVSGGCHLGGVDYWAQELAEAMGIETRIFAPKSHDWPSGYRPRNIQIADAADVVCVLVPDTYPPDYEGRRLPFCYHCGTAMHVKSDACWTGWYAQRRLGKMAIQTVITNTRSVADVA